jgi:hypothetical protein
MRERQIALGARAGWASAGRRRRGGRTGLRGSARRRSRRSSCGGWPRRGAPRPRPGRPARSGVTSPSCTTRRSLTWASSGSSPSSSRKTVPRWAASKTPRRCSVAPENAPFSWPNSVDSTSSRGMAPQLTATNLPGRRLAAWIARARSSLPVPDSPSIRIGTSQREARAAWSRTRAMTALRWMMSEKAASSGGAPMVRSARRAPVKGTNSAEMSKGTVTSRTPALGRRFDERGREAGLGDQEPDRVHRRGAGAQVEREVDVAAPGQDAIAGRDHGLVDLAVFGRSRQRAQVGLDQGVGARREGLLDPGGLARRLVAEDVDLVEAPLADGDGDGPDDARVAAGRLEVAIAEPGEQDAGHGTKVQRSLW